MSQSQRAVGQLQIHSIRILLATTLKTLTCAVLLVSICSSTVYTRQRPDKHLIHIDTSAASSLEELVARSYLIVHCRVVGTAQSVYKNTDMVVPMLAHSIEVTDILLNRGKTEPPTLVVSQPGGVAIVDGSEIRVDDRSFPYLLTSSEYVLFLDRTSSGETWSIVAGTNGMLRVTRDNGIATVGPSVPELRTAGPLTVQLVKARIASISATLKGK